MIFITATAVSAQSELGMKIAHEMPKLQSRLIMNAVVKNTELFYYINIILRLLQGNAHID